MELTCSLAALADSKFAAAVTPASRVAIVCLPKSPFIERWFNTYHTSNKQQEEKSCVVRVQKEEKHLPYHIISYPYPYHSSSSILHGTVAVVVNTHKMSHLLSYLKHTVGRLLNARQGLSEHQPTQQATGTKVWRKKSRCGLLPPGLFVAHAHSSWRVNVEWERSVCFVQRPCAV